MSPEVNGTAPPGSDASCASMASFGSSVTEWVITAVLRNSTVWPALMWMVSGSKLPKPILTVAPAFAETGPWAGPLMPQPARTRIATPGTMKRRGLAMGHLRTAGCHGEDKRGCSRRRDQRHDHDEL